MIRKSIRTVFILATVILLAACSKERSIYEGLGPEEDGVIDVTIPDDGEGAPLESIRHNVDELSSEEKKFVDDLHESEYDKLSFVVIDVENMKIKRSYLGETPRRLASISKLSTALGALERVNNVSVSKVRQMLKNSNNGEASRYVRLAAKAIAGIVSPPAYTDAHSCPNGFLEEEDQAHAVLNWLTSQIPEADWTDASINDGAGCHYDNFMDGFQIAEILHFADSRGKAYAGLNFEQLLSINGTDGTWKNKNTDHKGRIFAKTGTLNPNSNLAGYFYAKRQGVMKKYYFAVFIEKKGGGSYTTKARKLIESLMRYWINFYSAQEGDSLGDF
ncbi:MAG: D-alanyl-D-alanine carboxypeptidase [Bdellovibrionales bacterium]|nr:D-alanyl-D-alanine carboxypeptidase [Bdellovibrionales bacterium]